MVERLQTAAGSVRQTLALAGVGAVLLGAITYLFFRDLQGFSFIVFIIAGALLLVDLVISWKTVVKAVFGRRGRYGINTVIILIGFVAIAALANFVLYYLVNRPDPQGWLRADTTATKQSSLSDQAQNTVKNLKEPMRINAFFTTNTAARRAAWRNTEDMLAEFRRRSTVQPLEFKLIDPELDPNVAAEYGVTTFPALAVEGLTSRRTEVIVGRDPNETPAVFTEQELITGLLVVNQIRQKQVLFVSGHSERDILDAVGPEGYALAAQALVRENYLIQNVTLQELISTVVNGAPEDQPAAVIIADPRQELSDIDDAALVEYARRGGSVLVLIEPGKAPASIAGFLSRYGLAIGVGNLVDTASYVAPNPYFLQIKKSNSQIPPNLITGGFDVLYLPGSGYFATTVTPETVPLDENRRPFVSYDILALTTISSWAETDPENIEFAQETDTPGPLPPAIAVEAIAELSGRPQIVDGEYVTTNIVVVGDADFASNAYFASAKNGDMLVNSINWLARDFELITSRPKPSAFRELVLTRTERDFVRWTGWLLIPALVGVAGVWAWWVRR